jgi:SOS-response transcriptional repressor LexA
VLAAGDRLEFRTPGGDGVRELDELTDLPPVVRFGTHLPLYDLKARAGLWPRTQVSDPDDVDWISASEFGDLSPQLFAVRVDGDSMAPRIADGSVAVFQRTVGVPEGKVVLVARRDPYIDDAVSLLVKQLQVHQLPHGQVEYRLRSYNDAYPDIALSPEEFSRIEFVGVLKWGPQTE